MIALRSMLCHGLAVASALLGFGLRAGGETCDGAGTLFGAHLQRPVVEVSAETNGVAVVTCTVGLLGGCCFPLTSYGLTAVLDVPPGVTVVKGPEPEKYAAIEAPPSGTPLAWATFRWQIRRAAKDTGGEMTATVFSPDSGQVRAVYALGRQERIRVSGPQMPEAVAAGQEIALAVDAACLDEDRFVKRVRFWHSGEIPRDATEVAVAPGLEERGILQFMAGGKRLMVQGTPLELTRLYEPTVWRGKLAVATNDAICGVAVATDDTGRSACGPVARIAGPEVAKKTWLERLGFKGKSPDAGGVQPTGYPTEGSVAVYLFLDGGDASRKLAQQVETYRRAAPHRIHVLCFMEGATPPPLMGAYREKHRVGQLPSAVFDGRFCVAGTNTVALTGTLDRCMNKPSPRLSMELHGGVVAGRELSLGFIMCNHAMASEVRGTQTAFACENDVPVGGWWCDHIVRYALEEGRPYAVPAKKCQMPTLLKWTLPEGVRSKKVGALILLLNEAGQVVDSICTEKPCSRSGICG